MSYVHTYRLVFDLHMLQAWTRTPGSGLTMLLLCWQSSWCWLTDCCLPWTLAQYLWKCLSSYIWFYWSAFKVDKKKIHFLSRKHLLIWSWIRFSWFLLVRLNFYQLKIRFLLLHRRRSLSMLNRRSPNSTFITASNEAISILLEWYDKNFKTSKSIWLLLWLMQGSLVTLSFKIKLYR